MTRKNYILYSFAILGLIAAIFLYTRSYNKMKIYFEEVDRIQKVIVTIEKLHARIRIAQLLSVSTSDSIQEHDLSITYRQDMDSISFDVDRLKSLVRSEEQSARADSIAGIINTKLKFPDSLIGNPKAELSADEVLVLEGLLNRTRRSSEEKLATRKTNLLQSVDQINDYIVNLVAISLGIIIVTSVSGYRQTVKRRSAELFSDSLLNTSRNGIVSFRAHRVKEKIVDFVITFANVSISNFYNRQDSNELVGKYVTKVFSHVLTNGEMERFIQVVETGLPQEYEVRYERDGKYFWYLVMLAKLEDGVTVSVYNISQLKEYEAELNKKVEELEQTNNELEQFAYVASHDLQEPLRKIRVFVGRLEEAHKNTIGPHGLSYLNRIESSAQRMSGLIHDLLNFSRLTQINSSFQEVDINKTLANVLIDLDLTITEKKAVVHVGSMPVIEAIPLHMYQLLYNLVSNALKFSVESRDPRIDIACREVHAKELQDIPVSNKLLPHVEITVRDNGIGLKQEYADQIFVIFQRLNTREKYPGAGIGLALCRKIVAYHEGHIYVTSKEDQGATFHVIMPTRQAAGTMAQPVNS